MDGTEGLLLFWIVFWLHIDGCNVCLIGIVDQPASVVRNQNAGTTTGTRKAAVEQMNCQSIAHHAKNLIALHVGMNIPQLQEKCIEGGILKKSRTILNFTDGLILTTVVLY